MVLTPVIIMAVLFILGVPISFALLACVLPYFFDAGTSTPVYLIVQRMIAGTETQSLLAIPFFITAGTIMNYAGISRRLLSLADSLVGHMRGGLAQVNVVLSTMMGGLSGSCAADAAQECKILVPEMVRRGYDKPFCAAVTSASSIITPVIPPGIGMVLFGYLTSTSIGQLFAAGYIPGLLLMIGMMILVDYLSRKRNYAPSREKRATAREIGHELLDSVWALGLPVFLIVGLRTGIFTATEGGALCALYAFLIGKFVYKELKIKNMPAIMVEVVLSTCAVMFVICATNVFAYYMSWERIPHQLSMLIQTLTDNKWVFLLSINILFLFLGMFIEGTASMIILVPLLYPVALSLGIEPVHFGIVCVLNIVIGAITPPFGVIIYLVAPLMQIRVSDFIKELLPFIGVTLIVLMIITYCPWVFMWVPKLLF